MPNQQGDDGVQKCFEQVCALLGGDHLIPEEGLARLLCGHVTPFEIAQEILRSRSRSTVLQLLEHAGLLGDSASKERAFALLNQGKSAQDAVDDVKAEADLKKLAAKRQEREQARSGSGKKAPGLGT